MILAAATLLASTAICASAQVVRVRLVDAETRQPLAGVLVAVLDARGAVGPSVLSSSDGIAAVRVAGSEPQRLLIRRIGFAPVTTEPVAIPSDIAAAVDITVPAQRITLSTVHVIGSAVCTNQTESPSAAAQAAWTEVRTALEASALTRDQRLVTTTAFRYQRKLRLDGTAEGVDVAPLGESGERPFFAPAPRVLERDGYSKRHDDGSEDFYAPDEHVLLSSGFTRLHCVSVYPDVRHDSTGTQFALAFVPRDRDSRPEIRGLIWIDSATSELRRIDFKYVRIPFPGVVDSLGGSVQFAHLPSGAWIVSSWALRIPRWQLWDPMKEMVTRLAGYSEVGGSASVVNEVAVPAATVPRTITGSVFDSLAHRPLGGAHVHLADLNRDVTTDSLGQFRFDSVSAGSHEIWADHPALDALGLFSLGTSVDASPQVVTSVALAVPSFTTLWRSACGSASAPHSGEGFVFGRALSGLSSAPAPGTAIELAWEGAAADSAQKPAPGVRRRTSADSTGSYAFCGIADGRLVTLSASGRGASTIPISFRAGPSRIARRDVTLPSSDVIAQVMSDTASIAPLKSADGGTIAGVVRDSMSQPVRDARVTVSGVSGEWRSTATGRYVVRGIPPGTRVVAIRGLGFVAERRLVTFAARDSANLSVSMIPLVTTLATVKIEDWRRFDAHRSELEQRRRFSFAYMADSLQLAKLPGVAEAFNFPGVYTKWVQGRWWIFMRGTNGIVSKGGSGLAMECEPSIFVDGMFTDIDFLNVITKDEIALIEVYNTAAEAPSQYAGTRTNCGVVLIWLKSYISP